MNKMLFALLCGSIGLNFYFINSEVIVEDNLDHESIEVNDEISIAQSSISKKPLKKVDKSKFKIFEKTKDLETGEEFEAVDYQASYEEGMEKWNTALAEFFEVKLGLEKAKLDAYKELAKERVIQIDNFTASLTKNAQSAPYFFTLEDDIALSDINKKFLVRLQGELGLKDYTEYKNFLKKYNQKLIETDKVDQMINF